MRTLFSPPRCSSHGEVGHFSQRDDKAFPQSFRAMLIAFRCLPRDMLSVLKCARILLFKAC